MSKEHLHNASVLAEDTMVADAQPEDRFATTVGNLPHRLTLSRRALLLAGVGALGRGLVDQQDVFAEEPTGTPIASDTTSHQEAVSHQGGETKVGGHEAHGSSLSNDATALGMVGKFGVTLGEILSGKRNGFDEQTALSLTSAEAARLAINSVFDRPAMEHDLKEFAASYPLVGLVLIPFAEVASRLKVSNDRIFEDESRTDRLIREIGIESRIFEQHGEPLRARKNMSAKKSAKMPQEHREFSSSLFDENNGDSEEPDLFDELHIDESLETWEAYKKELEENIVQALARNAAVTSTFGPFFTTYAASAVADANHSAIYQAIAKHEYAKNVIKQKKHGEAHGYSPVILPERVDELKQQAVDRAVRHMNGTGGFNHLSLALAANADGMGFFGDPPMLFYLQRHGPAAWLELSGKGLAIAQASNVVSNFIYLQKLGIRMDSFAFAKKFVGYEATSLKKIAQTFTNGALFDVSIKGSRGLSREMVGIISQLRAKGLTPEKKQQLLERVKTIPEPIMTVDIPTLAGEKLRIIKSKFTRDEDIQELLDHYQELFTMKNENDLAYYLNSPEFRAATESGDGRDKLKIMVEALRRVRSNEETNKLTALLQSLLFRTVINPDVEDHAELLHMGEEHTVPTTESIIRELQGMAISSSDFKIENTMKEIGNLSERQLTLLLSRLKEEEIAKMRGGEVAALEVDTEQSEIVIEARNRVKRIYDMLGIVVDDQVREAMEDALLLAEGEEAQYHDRHGLSHQAEEVRDALFSQLPVTPSLAHLIIKGLDMYGEQGDFTEQKLERMITATLGIDTLTSAFADNVVAYLLTETVLEELMRSYYGDEYDHYPDLQEAVWTGSVLTAMIAGANSKYGNGPNMLKQEYDEDGNPHSMRLNNTFANPYAIMQTALVVLGSRQLILNSLPQQPATQTGEK